MKFAFALLSLAFTAGAGAPVVGKPMSLAAAKQADKDSMVAVALAASKQAKEAHLAKVAQLNKKVEEAMLDLYMENAKGEMEGLEAAAPAPAPADTISMKVNGNQAWMKLDRFGREDTAHELTQASIYESNRMIDQIENTVVAETKRSMFRALTHLRGVTISSFDGNANTQTANIDDYAAGKVWTSSHDLDHLAEHEGDVKTWAYAPNADLVQKQRHLQAAPRQ
jgi:hypothetical protein